MSTNNSSSATSEWLQTATVRLEKAGVGTARLDCLVLLEDLTGKDRSWLLAHPEYRLSQTRIKILDGRLERRMRHEPLAYIRGKSEFYGREFLVSPHTLEPRPETETMVDLLRAADVKSGDVVIDVGTGSGCIAITAKLEKPELAVAGFDIDRKCIRTAERNTERLGADITLIESDLLEKAAGRIDVLLCNLPYVPDKYELNAAAKFEPRHAIFGGDDGLDLYRRLFQQVSARSQQPRYILTESLPFQHQSLREIAKTSGYQETDENDFIQVFAASPYETNRRFFSSRRASK